MPAVTSSPSNPALLPIEKLAKANFGPDFAWYEKNIPFFDCSNSQIEQTYYYRWKLYKAHIRDIGERGTVITEFLDDVGWQKWPFASLNDATPFHIKEGRWLRDPRPVNEYIDFLYLGGGNDRHFSEAVAEATYANFLARGDLGFAAKYLPVMRHIYNLWDDHYDFSKGLYWIEPLLDATEYTISSIDATGGKDGFVGGQAFRPTINAYQYGNANAISRLASLTGDTATAQVYSTKAKLLKERVQADLWSDKFHHFIDRFQENNQFVKYLDPIRGRELAGYVPWAYELPDDQPNLAEAWKHIFSPEELGGPFGLRTVEPSYEYFNRQYRYLGDRPECQWNGPSWPFQTTQVLTGLANLLNDYHQTAIGSDDYDRLFEQYTQQHYLNGTPNLQEDYSAETGKPIVGLDRSHHYNHSGYVDLVVTGLCGIRPQANDSLVVNPLANRLTYFCLQNLPYHGHDLDVIWDASGTRYGVGKGLSVFVDGKLNGHRSDLGKLELKIGKPRFESKPKDLNLLLNVERQGFPRPSSNTEPTDSALWSAIDGRVWFFPEILRGWSSAGGKSGANWFQVDLGEPKRVSRAKAQFFEGGLEKAPRSASVEAWVDGAWRTVAKIQPVGNGPTECSFPAVSTDKLRILLDQEAPARLLEFAAFSQ